jgi:hypothetical protein
MIFFLLRVALTVLILADGADSRPGDFKIIGPGGGGAMFHPTVSPHDPNTVLVSCDMTGSYITHDGGKSWRMFNLRGVVQFFVFDPLNRKVIYAGSNGLWIASREGLRVDMAGIRSLALTGSGSSEYAAECVCLPLRSELGICTESIRGGALLMYGGGDFA